MHQQLSIVMMGATGAVGGACLDKLVRQPRVARITTLGRRPVEGLSSSKLEQHKIDIFAPDIYRTLLAGHDIAICTLGVGEPSKISKEDFVKIDKQAVLDFATRCKAAGVEHFQLLSSVGVSPQSASFFLRTKGELEDGLKGLQFKRLSLFHPSMILTPTNRYGFVQGLTLTVWPWLKPILAGGLRRYRGIEVSKLGGAMAANCLADGDGTEILEWDAIVALSQRQ
ncbi:NAD(P)H-binding protein [Sphingorhabdus sp. Alg231-15]|uniref:NAD(P)H-binding protein n=1 Tax=Sphingorhabdus sp. Alg231-15 TaxID=1922222 RepID=UPI000D55491E